MAHEDEQKSSAELQREIEMQRHRVENTIDQIQQKLSPGQLVDELLAYTKGGGSEFVQSLQRNVTANPLPVALLGVSLAWLMAKPAGAVTSGSRGVDRARDPSIAGKRPFAEGADDDDYDDHADYPVTVISGSSLQRVGRTRDEHGRSFSEFTDDAGRKFRAMSDETGKRAGHFLDETGSRFRGFTNAAGERIENFRDETGSLLDEASGWASHTWKKVREKLHDARDAIGSGAGAAGQRAGDAAYGLQNRVDQLNQVIANGFRDQPLVGGALAFALGAALGGALPHTRQEDKVLGEAADKLKSKAADAASDLYDKGKDRAVEVYATASDKVSEVYEQAKEGASKALDVAPSGGSPSGGKYNPRNNA